MAEIIHVTKDNFQDVLSQNEVVFVDFYANWCGPCKMLTPSVEKLANEHPEVKVVKVDIDNEPEIAMNYQVQSIPTLITFKNGEATARQLGFVPYEKLEDMIK
jgi:thioredoxin 1